MACEVCFRSQSCTTYLTTTCNHNLYVACTAVVTEISYHTDKNIAADVSFLTEKEWREELQLLLEDLVDEDGTLKRTTDLRSEAGVAWHKVCSASYP